MVLEDLRDAWRASTQWFRAWLTPRRLILCVGACLLVCLILAVVTRSPAPLALAVLAWFAPRLLRW